MSKIFWGGLAAAIIIVTLLLCVRALTDPERSLSSETEKTLLIASRPDPIHKFIDESVWILEAQVPDSLPLSFSERKLISNFNREKLHDNFLGSNKIETWTNNPSDDTQMTRIRTSSENYNPKIPSRSLKVIYDVESRIAAANGFWIRFQGLNLENYDYLSLWIKGSEKFKFTDTLGVGLIDQSGEVVVYRVSGLTNTWQNIRIKLKEKKSKLNWASIRKVYFIFKSTFATSPKGILYLDDIEFLRLA